MKSGRIITYSLIAVFLILVVPIGLVSFVPQLRCGTYYGKGLSNEAMASKTSQQIADALTANWLSSHKPYLSCPGYWIGGYVAKPAQVLKEDKDGFEYSVSYDLQKARFFSGGWEENKVHQDGDWIRNTNAFVIVKHTESGYRIESVGSGF